MTGPETCPRFGSCSAPLCPLETGKGVELTQWYTDEDICNEHPNLDWVKRQRRLKKLKKTGYFTIGMLVVEARISNGVDPDSEETPEDWIQKRLRSA